MDSWESLTSRMPRDLDYEALYERFSWDLPSRYNIGVDIFDWHAGDKGKLALIHDRGDGTAEKWTFFELKRASDRLANALRGLGVAGSMGRPVPGHRVAVIDESGDELHPGKTGGGAIHRPDPMILLRYWNDGEATGEKFLGEWLRTGDLASVDDEGSFRFVGRDGDLIVSAGYRIGPAEIEDTLTRHEDALMAAVGKPDETRAEVVKAFVVLGEGQKEHENLARELQELVRERLGAHEYPREFEFVEELPTTATGKIRRNVLREREAREGARR